VDGAIEMECPGSGEGANGALARAIDLHILDIRCARLAGRFRRPIFPCSVRYDVGDRHIVDQGDTLPLFVLNLYKLALGHAKVQQL
jgi:hypothetical protein